MDKLRGTILGGGLIIQGTCRTTHLGETIEIVLKLNSDVTPLLGPAVLGAFDN